MWRGLNTLVVVGLAILLVGGCSRHPSTVPVTGSLSYEGKPLDGALVSFTPVAEGHAATGETDGAGTYTLSTFGVGDGAVPGEYVVTIQKLQADKKGGMYARHRLVTPAQYADAGRSDLRAEVSPRDSNEFDFTLEE